MQFPAMRIRMNEDRERRLAKLQEATGENTKAGAIDVAVAHYLADLRAKEEVASLLDDELAERLSTRWLPIEKTTNIGRKATAREG